VSSDPTPSETPGDGQHDGPIGRTLPMFPLGMVVFPTEPVPLHIFEPRYRQLIADCEREDSEFGIVLGDGKTTKKVGCALVIDRVLERMDDGRVNLIANGTRRFLVKEWIPGQPEADPVDVLPGEKLYDRALVDWLQDFSEDWDDQLATGVFTLHRLLIQLVRKGTAPDAEIYGGLNHLSFTAGFASGLDPETKQQILEMQTEDERLQAIASHLTRLLPQLKAIAELQNEVDQKWSLLEEG